MNFLCSGDRKVLEPINAGQPETPPATVAVGRGGGVSTGGVGLGVRSVIEWRTPSTIVYVQFVVMTMKYSSRTRTF